MKNKRLENAILTAALICVAGVISACGSASPQATVPPQATAQSPATVQPAATVKPSAPAPAADGAALLDARCTGCHNLDRVKQAKRTRDQWAQTVTRMVGKGAQLSAAEQTTLIDYLSKTYGP